MKREQGEARKKELVLPTAAPKHSFSLLHLENPPQGLFPGALTPRSRISRVCGSQGQYKEEAKIQPGGGRKEGNIPLAIGEKRNFPSS